MAVPLHGSIDKDFVVTAVHVNVEIEQIVDISIKNQTCVFR